MCVLCQLRHKSALKFAYRHPVKFIKILLAIGENRIIKRLSLRYFSKVTIEQKKKISNKFSPGLEQYEIFIKSYEPILHQQVEHLLSKYSERPKISLITPLYNTPPALFDELYASICSQTHEKWEWILVDDCSPKTSTVNYIAKKIKKDPRVSLILSETNGHISRATNKGIEAATGDIIAFADHDDLLASVAFASVALSSLEYPDAEWFYSDEDFLDLTGKRHSPHLKSVFNPELLKTHNYITHFSAVRKETLVKVGMLDPNCDGAQDYDLHLRLANELDADQIVHIPLILYHWRQIEGSTALDGDSKSYTDVAGLNALKKIADTCEHPFKPLSSSAANYYNGKSICNYSLISIIIPFKDHVELLKTCVSSVDKTSKGVSYEYVLVDNGSSEIATLEYLETLKDRKDVTLVKDNQNFNFSRLMNLGAENSNGDILLLLNNDIEATDDGWLDQLGRNAAQPHNGAVGLKLFYPDGTLQHTGIGVGLGGYAAHNYRSEPGTHPGRFGRLRNSANVAGVTAAALAVKKELYWKVGGFKEEFQVAYNDVDFNLELLKAGYWNVCLYTCSLIHYESKSRGSDDRGEKIARFDKEKALLLERWKDYLMDDPFFHPLLTYSNESASFAYEAEFLKSGQFVHGRCTLSKKHSLRKK